MLGTGLTCLVLKMEAVPKKMTAEEKETVKSLEASCCLVSLSWVLLLRNQLRVCMAL